MLNQIVSDCTPAKTSYKTIWTKVNPAAKVKFSRKWNEQVKLWKQRLRYRIVRNEKIFLIGKKSFCKEAGEIFPSAKKKLFSVENKKVILSI